MAWLVLCRDVPDSEALRKRHLERHLAYVETIMDEIAVAGPLAPGPGGAYAASCFVYDTDDRERAEALLHDDPYHQAGLYREVEFHLLRPVAGGWVGGATWSHAPHTNC